MKIISIFLTSLLLFQSGKSINLEQKAREYLPKALEELNSFIQIPNASLDTLNIENNVDWCEARFKDLGFQVETHRIGTTPFVLATNVIDDIKPTLLVYLQIDGQPVDQSKWNQENAYIPMVKRNETQISWINFISNPEMDDKIYARSSSDSKGPAISFISALQILKEEKQSLLYNLKVVMDFQEEISSPQMPRFVEENKHLLEADYLLIMDGSRFARNEPTLTFGARGIAKMVLTVYGPNLPLHSGQYGNFIPNPVFKASRLIANMKDVNGVVKIPGWYDGIEFSEKEQHLMNLTHVDSKLLANEMGVTDWNKVGSTYQEALQYPTLNIRGLQSGWVGKDARTIIPDKVVIEIDIRLVPEIDGTKMIEMVRNYILKEGYHILVEEPTKQDRMIYKNLIKVESNIGYPAFQTSLDSPIGEWLTLAHHKAIGQNPIKMRRTGGSQPMAPFIKALNIPVAAVRIPNPDNNIHGPNENIRVGNFLEGIQINLGILNTPIVQN